MRDVQAKLDELADRLNRIRRKLRQLPAKREELESIYDELKSQWPEQLGKWSIGELDEAELDEARRELTIASRNLKELGELEKGLLAMERSTLKLMKPLQKKEIHQQAEERYQALKAKLQAGNYDKGDIGTFRQTAHQLGRDRECNELLKKLEYIRDRELSFGEVHGLQAQ